MISLPAPDDACAQWVNTVLGQRDLASAWPFTSFALRQIWVTGNTREPALMLGDGPQQPGWAAFEAKAMPAFDAAFGWFLNAGIDTVNMLSPYVASIAWLDNTPGAVDEAGVLYQVRRLTMVQEAGPTPGGLCWLFGGWDDSVADVRTNGMVSLRPDATAPPSAGKGGAI